MSNQNTIIVIRRKFCYALPMTSSNKRKEAAEKYVDAIDDDIPTFVHRRHASYVPPHEERKVEQAITMDYKRVLAGMKACETAETAAKEARMQEDVELVNKNALELLKNLAATSSKESPSQVEEFRAGLRGPSWWLWCYVGNSNSIAEDSTAGVGSVGFLVAESLFLSSFADVEEDDDGDDADGGEYGRDGSCDEFGEGGFGFGGLGEGEEEGGNVGREGCGGRGGRWWWWGGEGRKEGGLRRHAQHRLPAHQAPQPPPLCQEAEGCFAGGTVLHLAKDLAKNNVGACILVVCSEITAVTFRGPSDTHLDSLVGHALFGDGAIAVIVGVDPDVSV
ncbi:hypothetical protein RJ640_027766 [Escallonia rubra]|uniref:Chalcone/stilbene synthase N-terminal domain-containing protein n=1 Tax=Escallonia rubra TaxID=112253 RepID=A0AA88R164_9ASTE|nr:hypothetical protein RJ640_027766 [Escallonia rubra]